MAKHAKKSSHLQIVDLPKTATVEIPLPLLGAFANIENSFFDLCIGAGRQVLGAMMEQDREDLCGPRWKRDPDRSAGRAGTTESEVNPEVRADPGTTARSVFTSLRRRAPDWTNQGVKLTHGSRLSRIAKDKGRIPFGDPALGEVL